MKKNSVCTELELLGKSLEARWLKKEISKEQLPIEMKKLVSKVKKNEEQFELWKEYLRVKCKLDEVAKNGEVVLISLVAFVFSAISCVSDMGLNMEHMNPVTLVCIIVMLVGVFITAVSAAKPYLGTYVKERTFYELLLFYAENVKEEEK